MRRSSNILSLQRLEARRLLHATLTASTGFLYVQSNAPGGTTVLVYRTGASIAVKENNDAPQLFPASQVKDVFVDTYEGNDRVTLAPGLNVRQTNVRGGAGNDTLIGSDGPDTLFGNGGDDQIFGNGGNDLLDSGAYYEDQMARRITEFYTGQVTTIAGNRNTLYGGAGNDTLEGGPGNDEFFGDAGNDWVSYRWYNNPAHDYSYRGVRVSLDGVANDGVGHFSASNQSRSTVGDENDNAHADIENIWGGDRHDTLVGGAGANYIYGDMGSDQMSGGAGNDTLVAGMGNDSMYGNDGNDTLDGQDDNDVFSGGGGFDSADYRLAPAGVKVSVDGIANDTLTVNGIVETDNVLDVEQILGSRFHDTLSGGANVNQIFGGPGNDVLNGMGNNDSVYGGPGEDTIRGGDGNDTLDGQNENDKVYGDAGNDSLLGGSGGDLLDGGIGNDRLDGQAGNDYLWGGANDDVLIGGAGADQLFGSDGNDTLFSRDNEPDKLDGGNGFDKAQVDSKDMRARIESLLA